jgi:assimilatory nitrate reductase electron transfer subunit
MKRTVIVGHGMAGGRLVEELVNRGVSHGVTVVGGEPYGAYNRVLLSDVVAGRADVATLGLSDPDAIAATGVDVRLGTHAVRLDRDARRVVLDDGTALPYDDVVLATGSRAIVPPLAGLQAGLPGVHAFRTLDDCREIVAAAANATRAVVLGGGLLGLEAARGLVRRGIDVTLLHAAPHLMERQLDPTAGAVLALQVHRLGLQVRTGVTVTGVRAGADGRLAAVVFSGGADGAADEVPADLLVLACGVRPEAALAQEAGLAVNRGVVVDDRLATSDPRVRAIGDCAEFDGVPGGLVAPAWEQARVVADLLSGRDPGARWRAGHAVTRLKADNLDVASAGETQTDLWEPDAEVVQLADPGRGRYVKAVVRGGVVTGAVCVGAPRAAAELTLLVERGSPAPADRTALLLPGARPAAPDEGGDPTLIPDRATVCRCNGVTKGALVAAWSDGARTVEGVAARTRATTGCGTCRDTVCGLLDWLAAADPDPDTSPVTGPVVAPAVLPVEEGADA